MSQPLADYLVLEGLTQSELARRSKVPRENINRVLNGKKSRFSVAEAGKLAGVTGISALLLLGLAVPDMGSPKKKSTRGTSRSQRR